MDEKIDKFIEHVKEISRNPEFRHHKWFVKYHLEIVDKIAQELCSKYPEADKDFVKVLVWIHDYGKAIDFDNQYNLTITMGREKLLEFGFAGEFVDKVIDAMKIIDRKVRHEIEDASIEIKIVSSADGASHHYGPFMSLWWHENSDKYFEDLMRDNIRKSDKDWKRKIVLPEVIDLVRPRRAVLLEQSGQLPEQYLSS